VPFASCLQSFCRSLSRRYHHLSVLPAAGVSWAEHGRSPSSSSDFWQLNFRLRFRLFFPQAIPLFSPFLLCSAAPSRAADVTIMGVCAFLLSISTQRFLQFSSCVPPPGPKFLPLPVFTCKSPLFFYAFVFASSVPAACAGHFSSPDSDSFSQLSRARVNVKAWLPFGCGFCPKIAFFRSRGAVARAPHPRCFSVRYCILFRVLYGDVRA